MYKFKKKNKVDNSNSKGENLSIHLEKMSTQMIR